MREKKKRVNPFKRKIHLPDGEWTYRWKQTSSSIAILQVRPPSLDRTHTYYFNYSYTDYSDYGDYDWDYEYYTMWAELKPSLVKATIEEKILKSKASEIIIYGEGTATNPYDLLAENAMTEEELKSEKFFRNCQ